MTEAKTIKRKRWRPWKGAMPAQTDEQVSISDVLETDPLAPGTEVRDRHGTGVDRDFSDKDYESEDLDNGADTEDNKGKAPQMKYLVFVRTKKMTDFKYEVGMYFENKDDFKEAIRTFIVHSCRNLKL